MRVCQRWTRVALACLLAGAVARETAAQGVNGRVSGVIRDDFGDPIKGATITALNDDNGTSFTGTTDSKGRFVMIGLRPGLWRMIAQAPGHSPIGGEQRLRSANNPILLFTLQKRSPRPDGPLANVSAKTLQSDLAAADQLFDQGLWEQAIAAYGAILRQSPSLTAIQLQIATAYRAKGDAAGADAVYKSLLASEPSNERARVELAALALERNDVAGAESFLTTAAESDAPGREVLVELGEVKAHAGDVTEAVRLFKQAASVDPGWGRPVYRLGTLAMQQGDRAGAARYLERVVAVDPKSEEATLARSLMNQLK